MAVLDSAYRGSSSPTTSTWRRLTGRRRRGGTRPGSRHRRGRSDLRVLSHGPGQPRPRDGARRLPPGSGGPARPGVVLLRGPRLQAPPRHAGLAGGQAPARASVADARHRPARARRGAQAASHLVLHVADRPARAGPRSDRPHGGPGPRAVLAPGPAAGRVGRDSPTSSDPDAQRPARGESGGSSTEPPAEGCPSSDRRAGGTDGPDTPILAPRRPRTRASDRVHTAETSGGPIPAGERLQAIAGWGATSPISMLSSTMSSGARSRSSLNVGQNPGSATIDDEQPGGADHHPAQEDVGEQVHRVRRPRVEAADGRHQAGRARRRPPSPHGDGGARRSSSGTSAQPG